MSDIGIGDDVLESVRMNAMKEVAEEYAKLEGYLVVDEGVGV